MKIFLDANVAIYAVESASELSLPAQNYLVSALETGHSFMVSELVVMECLVYPFRTCDLRLLQHYEAFFDRPEIEVVSISSIVTMKAAIIRALHNLRAMDSLHFSAAIENKANLFLTADVRLSQYSGIPVEILRQPSG